MARKRLTIGGLIVLVVFMGLACSITDNMGDRNLQAPEDDQPDGSGVNYPEDAPWLLTQWPEGIPDDIPEFNAQIYLVIDSPTHYRIFYENVTRKQLETYLQTLEDAGFSLEYAVYTSEGHPDNSEERIKKGEYDAVYITKGDYRLRIEWGEDTTVLDVYKSGFP